MGKFIYVFSEEDRDKLIQNSYQLLKSDEKNGIYIFSNDGSFKFSKFDLSYIMSDVMTF